jgi:hypothetical protein
VARAASLDRTRWLPAYGWWPPPSEYDATVVLSPYHAAVEPEARLSFTLRGYLGSNEPVWEHDAGELGLGDERGIRLIDLDVPEPPPEGGILEVHGVRHDRQPKKGTGFIGMWIDAQTSDGGGYIIPTIPIRAQAKAIQRDDVQVIPGILASKDLDTELVLLNVVDAPTEVRLVARSVEGLVSETEPFVVQPWTVWRGSLKRTVPRLRRMLQEGEGVGSLAIHSSHRLLPYFGFRRGEGSLLSLDHAAPIFA